MLENIVNNHIYTTIPPKMEFEESEELPTAPEFESMTSFEIGILYSEIFEDELSRYEDLIFIWRNQND